MLKLKGCARCGGDLKVDERDWQCLQCGHYYYDGMTTDNQHGQEGRLESLETLGLGRTAGGKWAGNREVMNLADRRPKTPAVASSRATRRGRARTIPRK